MSENIWEVFINESPPRMSLFPSSLQIVEVIFHSGMRIVLTIIQKEGIGVVKLAGAWGQLSVTVAGEVEQSDEQP